MVQLGLRSTTGTPNKGCSPHSVPNAVGVVHRTKMPQSKMQPAGLDVTIPEVTLKKVLQPLSLAARVCGHHPFDFDANGRVIIENKVLIVMRCLWTLALYACFLLYICLKISLIPDGPLDRIEQVFLMLIDKSFVNVVQAVGDIFSILALAKLPVVVASLEALFGTLTTKNERTFLRTLAWVLLLGLVSAGGFHFHLSIAGLQNSTYTVSLFESIPHGEVPLRIALTAEKLVAFARWTTSIILSFACFIIGHCFGNLSRNLSVLISCSTKECLWSTCLEPFLDKYYQLSSIVRQLDGFTSLIWLIFYLAEVSWLLYDLTFAKLNPRADSSYAANKTLFYLIFQVAHLAMVTGFCVYLSDKVKAAQFTDTLQEVLDRKVDRNDPVYHRIQTQIIRMRQSRVGVTVVGADVIDRCFVLKVLAALLTYWLILWDTKK